MAKYKNRTVKLNKPMRGDVKKFKVFVKNRKTGRVVKVNFGDKKLSIKKNIPARKKSFFARFTPILNKAKRSGKQLNTTPVYWAVKSWRKGFKIRLISSFIGYLVVLMLMLNGLKSNLTNLKRKKRNLKRLLLKNNGLRKW